MRAFVIITAVMTVLAASAQPARERILLPVIVETPIPGAYGSLWETEVALVSTSRNLVSVYGIETGCPLPTCGAPNVVAPGTTLYLRTQALDAAINAHLLEVTDDPDAVSVQITVHDRSRALDTWGTSVPAVREREAWLKPFQLLDVPGARSRFRSLLRVYSFAPMQSARARIRIFQTSTAHERPYEAHEPDRLLVERTVDLRVSSSKFTPGYVQIPLWDIPEIQEDARLRIEIVPETAGIALWGMVSVTNNETQHVTLIAPQ